MSQGNKELFDVLVQSCLGCASDYELACAKRELKCLLQIEFDTVECSNPPPGAVCGFDKHTTPIGIVYIRLYQEEEMIAHFSFTDSDYLLVEEELGPLF
jgi:hypothetical protein